MKTFKFIFNAILMLAFSITFVNAAAFFGFTPDYFWTLIGFGAFGASITPRI